MLLEHTLRSRDRKRPGYRQLALALEGWRAGTESASVRNVMGNEGIQDSSGSVPREHSLAPRMGWANTSLSACDAYANGSSNA